MRLHFSIGCHDRRRTSRRRHGFQFSEIQTLFADHVHRRSGVYNKFSFLKFPREDGAGRHQFPKVRRMLFYLSPLISGCIWPASTLLHGTSLLPFRLFLRPILKFWSIGVTLMKITWANHSKRWIFGLQCKHVVRRLL